MRQIKFALSQLKKHTQTVKYKNKGGEQNEAGREDTRIKEEKIYEEKEMMCIYEFAKVSPKSKKLFAGEIYFPLSDESTYKPLIDRIVDSLKEK